MPQQIAIRSLESVMEPSPVRLVESLVRDTSPEQMEDLLDTRAQLRLALELSLDAVLPTLIQESKQGILDELRSVEDRIQIMSTTRKKLLEMQIQRLQDQDTTLRTSLHQTRDQNLLPGINQELLDIEQAIAQLQLELAELPQ